MRKNWEEGGQKQGTPQPAHAAVAIIHAASSIRLRTENKVLNGRETRYVSSFL